LCEEVKVRADQKVSITYWDKNERVYKEIELDSTLISTFGMYWDIRRLPLCCSVVEPVKQPDPSSANTEVDQSAINLSEQPDEQSDKEPDKEPEPWSGNTEVDQSANNLPQHLMNSLTNNLTKNLNHRVLTQSQKICGERTMK
jgi:hypothetical protein